MSPLETKLRQLAMTLDASALEALASKGLLRRAQKDLERGNSISVVGEAENWLKLRVDAFDVRLPEAGPSKAQCSCPAAGICQHILAAVLHLQKRDVSAPATEEPDVLVQAEKELLEMRQDELERWAGKAAFRAGVKMALHNPVEVMAKGSIVIRFPTNNLQCHYVPGGGIEGMIISGTAKDERQVVVAAIFAFLKSKGVQWELPDDVSSILEEATGAPRSRTDVISAAQALMAEMLRNGLARLSPPTRERLATLAVSALGVNLPKLSLALRGLSDECSLVLGRDARSDLGRLLGRMANTYALCSALKEAGANPRTELVGAHRTQYAEIGNIDLIGVAAWPWETASGYLGLTVLFWDVGANTWNSWSESRPRHQSNDFDPLARYDQSGPWAGADSPKQLAGSHFRLMNARRNPAGRLSSSTKSRTLITGTSDLRSTNIPVSNEWEQIFAKSTTRFATGLKEGNPLSAIVVLQPSEWGPRSFNEVTQTFRWVLLDKSGQAVPLEIRFNELNSNAIKFLENVAPESLVGTLVVARIEGIGDRQSLYPLSIHQNGTVVHLALDTIKTKASERAAKRLEDEEEDSILFEVETDDLTAPDTAIARFLDEAEDGLLAVAEAGTDTRNPLVSDRLEQISQRALRRNLEFLAAQLRKCSSGNLKPTDLLRATYITRLHRQCSLVESGESRWSTNDSFIRS